MEARRTRQGEVEQKVTDLKFTTSFSLGFSAPPSPHSASHTRTRCIEEVIFRIVRLVAETAVDKCRRFGLAFTRKFEILLYLYCFRLKSNRFIRCLCACGVCLSSRRMLCDMRQFVFHSFRYLCDACGQTFKQISAFDSRACQSAHSPCVIQVAEA